jgi:hypothetical protein
MSEAEAHATDDADGHGFFIDSLLGTDVTLHLIPPLYGDWRYTQFLPQNTLKIKRLWQQRGVKID